MVILRELLSFEACGFRFATRDETRGWQIKIQGSQMTTMHE